ncbi:MAG: hypothetical protein ACON5J_18955 [Rubripirellula sp.]
MQHDDRIYNKIEFSIPRGYVRFEDFGRDLLQLIQKYQYQLVGYQAELVNDDGGDSNVVDASSIYSEALFKESPFFDSAGGMEEQVLCEDGDADEARRCIEEIYGIM